MCHATEYTLTQLLFRQEHLISHIQTFSLQTFARMLHLGCRMELVKRRPMVITCFYAISVAGFFLHSVLARPINTNEVAYRV